MALFDRLKRMTGLGLSSDETYNRAFEKGVLAGNFSQAAELFSKSAEKFQKDGNQDGYNRAMANHWLYLYVVGSQGQQGAGEQIRILDQAIGSLGNLNEIEKVGSQTEMVPASLVVEELSGKKYELLAQQETALDVKSDYHAKAAEHFGKLGESIFVTSQQSARKLYYYHTGSSIFHKALVEAQMHPDTAVEHLQEAYSNFQLGEASGEATQAQILSRKFATTEVCWVCGRKVQGKDLHFQYYEAQITPYYRSVVQSEPYEKQVELSNEGLPLCTTCGSMFNELADSHARRRANEVREELTELINSLVAELREVLENHNRRINELVDAVNELNRYSHRH